MNNSWLLISENPDRWINLDTVRGFDDNPDGTAVIWWTANPAPASLSKAEAARVRTALRGTLHPSTFVVCQWCNGEAIDESDHPSIFEALCMAVSLARGTSLVTLERVMNPAGDRALVCSFGDDPEEDDPPTPTPPERG